jgi:phosphoribosylformylglycinamidine (FGAM) synthase PurS component
MAAGSVVALIYLRLTIDVKPGLLDPRGTRVKAGLTYLTVTLSLVVIFTIVRSLIH